MEHPSMKKYFVVLTLKGGNYADLSFIFFSWRYNPRWGLYFTAL